MCVTHDFCLLTRGICLNTAIFNLAGRGYKVLSAASALESLPFVFQDAAVTLFIPDISEEEDFIRSLFSPLKF